MLDYKDILNVVEYNEESPTCLVWKDNKRKAGSLGKRSSSYIKYNGTSYVISRIILMLHGNEDLKDKYISFIDGDNRNLKIDNLRIGNSLKSGEPPVDNYKKLKQLINKNSSLQDNRFYVYFHIDDFGIVRYIGKGSGLRYKSKSDRGQEWKNIFKNFTDKNVVIYKDKLTNEEAIVLENNLINEYKDTIVNKIPSHKIKEISNNISEYVYYDETSPTFLRWKKDIGWNGMYFKSKKDYVAGTISKSGYVNIAINKSLYKAHRIIWALHNGYIDSTLVIDHIDRNRTNNRISNLRLVTNSVNVKNRTLKLPNISERGIHLRKTSFVVQATIGINKTVFHFNFEKYSGKENAFNEAIKFRDFLVKNNIIII